MKKSILLTSLIAVLCLSVLFTAPAAASVGGGEDVEPNPKKTTDYFIYLPLVTRNFGAPKLVSPANGSTLNTLIPEFVWEEMEIPMWFMMVAEISENDDFSTIGELASQKTNTSAQLYFNLKPATKYYWRAFVINWADLTRYPYSETRSFTTPSHGVLPGVPTLKSPAHESVIESGPVVMEVNEVPGATGYQFWYKEVGDELTYIINSDSPQFTIAWYELSPGKEYQWWAKAKNEYGFGDYSYSSTFSLSSSYTAGYSAKDDQNHHFLIYNEETNTFTQR